MVTQAPLGFPVSVVIQERLERVASVATAEFQGPLVSAVTLALAQAASVVTAEFQGTLEFPVIPARQARVVFLATQELAPLASADILVRSVRAASLDTVGQLELLVSRVTVVQAAPQDIREP